MRSPRIDDCGRMRTAGGFTLLEAMVAFAIVTVVICSFLGIRTQAIIDATEARNHRLAVELAQRKLSELQAGARETPAKTGDEEFFDGYKGFSSKIYIGEAAVDQAESDLASAQSDEQQDRGAASERNQWQQNRELERKSLAAGLTDSTAYKDQLAQQQYDLEQQDKPATETDLQDVAVVVYFPRVVKDGKDTYMIKAKVSTLALTNMTPDEARTVAESKGQTVQEANAPPSSGGANGSSSGNGSASSGSSPSAPSQAGSASGSPRTSSPGKSSAGGPPPGGASRGGG